MDQEVYLGPWQQRVKSIEDKTIDLVVTDPPYGVTLNAWDNEINFQKFWATLERICKPTAICFQTN